MVGPSGPRRLRLAIEHLAQFRGGMCFMVDLDPRWVIKLIKMGEMEMMELYKRHVIDQALTLLKAHDGIKCLFTTPKLLEALCERISLKKAGITGVFCGGTEMTQQFHRFAVEELMEGAEFRPTYGNTLMGLAASPKRRPEDNWAIIYYPPSPRAMIEVVDPDDPWKLVEYGKTGRTRLTTLTKEFFMPRFLERDECEREAPCEQYPWDGVRNVRPFSRFKRAWLKEFIDAPFTNSSMGSSVSQRQSSRDAALPHARAVCVDEPGERRADSTRSAQAGRSTRAVAGASVRRSRQDGPPGRRAFPERYAAARSGERHDADATAIHRAGVGDDRHAVQQRAPQHDEGAWRPRQGRGGARRPDTRHRSGGSRSRLHERQRAAARLLPAHRCVGVVLLQFAWSIPLGPTPV
jgi:hypothetical protein